MWHLATFIVLLNFFCFFYFFDKIKCFFIETIDNQNGNHTPKVKYDDEKYDVFFSFMVQSIDPLYLETGTGKIKLKAEVYGDTPFKSFSIQVANKTNQKKNLNKLYTKVYKHAFGYEFDINDRNFNIISGSYADIGAAPVDKFLIESKQKDIKEQQYLKEQSLHTYKYTWNKQLNQKHGTDLRDVIVPKIISRLEDVEMVVNKGIKGAKELTRNVYKTHQEKANCSCNSSFDEKTYNSFEEDSKGGYVLSKMNLNVEQNNVYFNTYNEVVAAPICEDTERRVLPKRLICDISKDIYNEFFIEFCEANKIYKSFKNILKQRGIFAELNKEAQDKLDEMIKIYEENAKDSGNQKVSGDSDNKQLDTQLNETCSNDNSLPFFVKDNYPLNNLSFKNQIYNKQQKHTNNKINIIGKEDQQLPDFH